MLTTTDLMMDLHSTPEVELHNATPHKISLLEQLQLHQILPTSHTPDAMPKPLTEDRLQALLLLCMAVLDVSES